MRFRLPRKLRVQIGRRLRAGIPASWMVAFAFVLYVGMMLLVHFTRGICTPEQMANGTCKPAHQLATEPKLNPADALTDLNQDGGVKPGKPRKPLRIPEKAEEWQKKPPCDEDGGEEMVNGACYGAMKRKPPCGPKLLQHGDTCYRTIAKAPREPSSIER